MASSTLKGLVANSGKLGYQLWHRPLKMASLVYEREIGIGETDRRLGDRFREHLRDVEKDDKDAQSKPVARHLNLPNHSKQYMAVCGLFLHQGSTESRKTPSIVLLFYRASLNITLCEVRGLPRVVAVSPCRNLSV